MKEIMLTEEVTLQQTNKLEPKLLKEKSNLS
jgi:hypothetical protein